MQIEQTHTHTPMTQQLREILISNFRRVLNVVSFLLGDSSASEIYMPTFRNTLFRLHRQVGACRMNSGEGSVGVLYGKRFGLEMVCAIRTGDPPPTLFPPS